SLSTLFPYTTLFRSVFSLFYFYYMSESTYTNKVSHFYALLKQSIRGDEHDYTQGSLRSAIVLLAIPMILELSLESVFAVVDMYLDRKSTRLNSSHVK